MPAMRRLIDQPRAQMGIEHFERALPICRPAAKLEYRLPCPGQARRGFRGSLGEMPGRAEIFTPLRLDIETTQTEQPGVAIPRHLPKGGFGARPIACELRGLRLEQQRERLILGETPRLLREPPRGSPIADPDRDQAACDGEAAFA